jgi:hypothetical protein
MTGDKFVFLSGKLSGCDSFSSGLKQGVRESQWIGWYGKSYISQWPTASLGAIVWEANAQVQSDGCFGRFRYHHFGIHNLVAFSQIGLIPVAVQFEIDTDFFAST